MVAVVARVEAAGGIGTLEALSICMSSVVAVGKGIPITLPVLTTTPSHLARLSPNRTPRLVSTPTYLHTTQRWLFLALPVSRSKGRAAARHVEAIASLLERTDPPHNCGFN